MENLMKVVVEKINDPKVIFDISSMGNPRIKDSRIENDPKIYTYSKSRNFLYKRHKVKNSVSGIWYGYIYTFNLTSRITNPNGGKMYREGTPHSIFISKLEKHLGL